MQHPFIRKAICFIVFKITLMPLYISAQSADRQVIASYALSVSNGSVQAEATAGETVTATFIGGSFMLTQGFHQSMAEDSSMSVQEIQQAAVSYLLYPNPAQDNITLTLISDKAVRVKINITDMSGRIVYSHPEEVPAYPESNTTISLDGMAAAAYVFHIISTEGVPKKSLKFIKRE